MQQPHILKNRQPLKGRLENDWIDISVPVHDSMTCWPGMPHVSVTRFLDLHKGDHSNVTMFSMSVHSGTHMDTPKHYFANGGDITSLPLDQTIGPAKVIQIENEYSITLDEVLKHDIQKGDRILFKTKNSKCDWTVKPFKKDYTFLSTSVATYLAEKKIRCVGIDYICLGGVNNQKLVHNILFEAGVWIIEGLRFIDVKPGDYELICLPLKLISADGAPARAVIRPI